MQNHERNIMKNIGKYLLATTALLGLAACQTTGSTTMGSAQGVFNTASASKTQSVETEITAKDDGGLTAVIDGKTYEFTKAELDAERKRPRFTKTLADGTRVRVDRHWAGDSEHSELWRVQIQNKTAKTEDMYFVAIGEKTAKPPTTGTAKYRGGFQTLLRNKTGGDAYKYVFSDLNLNVDFAKGTLTGQTSKHTLYSNEHEGLEFEGAIALSNGKIDGNKITADLASDAEFDSKVGLTSSLSGKLDGNFYGYYGSEIKGTGTLSNTAMIGAFGLGADNH